MAEKEGFEPSLQETCKPDFESGAFDHSATSPFYRAALEVWQVRQACNCSFFKAGLFSVALLFFKKSFQVCCSACACKARGSSGFDSGFDFGCAAHIGLQGRGDGYAAVGALVVFEDGYQTAPYGQAAAV